MVYVCLVRRGKAIVCQEKIIVNDRFGSEDTVATTRMLAVAGNLKSIDEENFSEWSSPKFRSER